MGPQEHNTVCTSIKIASVRLILLKGLAGFQMVRHGIRNDGPIRVAYRCTYVVLIAFVACSIPFFGDLMGFVGALGTGPTTFWM